MTGRSPAVSPAGAHRDPAVSIAAAFGPVRPGDQGGLHRHPRTVPRHPGATDPQAVRGRQHDGRVSGTAYPGGGNLIGA